MEPVQVQDAGGEEEEEPPVEEPAVPEPVQSQPTRCGQKFGSRFGQSKSGSDTLLLTLRKYQFQTSFRTILQKCFFTLINLFFSGAVNV